MIKNMQSKQKNTQKVHIKKGDTVRILSGSDRGKEGKVMVVNPEKQTAIVEGMKMVTKHRKPDQQNPQGSVVQMESPIHVSNLMLVEPKSGTPTRIGRKRAENGKGWVRVSKKTGEIIK